MAEAAVTNAIIFLTPLLVDQLKLLGGVRQEVASLKDELELLMAFLQDADQKQQSNPAVKVWVKQLREVAYDIEDVVDEFLVRVGMPSRQKGLAGAIRRGTACIIHLNTRCHISSGLKVSSTNSRKSRRGKKGFP